MINIDKLNSLIGVALCLIASTVLSAPCDTPQTIAPVQQTAATEISSETAIATSQLATREDISPPYELHYKASYNGLPIKITRSLSYDENGRIHVSSRAKNMIGRIEETSEFGFTESGDVISYDYVYDRSIFGKKKKESLEFDQQGKIVKYHSPNKTREHEMDRAYHNPVSYVYQLRQDVAAGDTAMSYSVIFRGKSKCYKFEVEGIEMVETGAGAIEAVKVRQIRDKDPDRETIYWFAPALGYALAQLKKQEDGEDYRITLNDGQVDGVEASTLIRQTSSATLSEASANARH